MFSYYGSKSKIVDYYPPPKHKKIIEPFAGSARYSLKYWQNDVLLVDKYEVVVEVWKYLQQCSEADILKLPKPAIGDDLRDYKELSPIEKKFMGFIVQAGQGKPANTVTKMSAFYANKCDVRRQIAGQLFKIRHWNIELGDYMDIENQEATWFIDPPYQFGGEHQYKFGNKSMCFKSLSTWCKSRDGQVIVCENTKADWLPFLPVIGIQGVNQTNTTEAIWTNQPTSYGAIQTKIAFQ